MTFDTTSNVTSSQTSTAVLFILSVTSGTSGLDASGGKNTIGQFPIISWLELFPSSLSYMVTPKEYSPAIFGKEKNT
jgi:hypothetical protein